MKTVTGRVITTHPISISRASSILSKFASSENGASQTVSAYLRRASVAFNELKSLHKELKSSSSKGKKPRSDVMQERNPTRESEKLGRPDDVNQGKKHKMEKESGEVGHLLENGGEIGGRESGTVREGKLNHERSRVSRGPSQAEEIEKKEGKNKKKKNKKKNEEEDENGDDGRVTEKSKADTVMKVESEGEHGSEETKKKKKKKKGKNGGETGSEEKKSKKMRKGEGD